MSDEIFENHLKGDYVVESGGAFLIIAARSCYRVQEEAAWLIANLPKKGTKQKYQQDLSRLGIDEARKILDRLIAIGVLRLKSDRGALRKLAGALLIPDIRLLPARWQENALRWAGIRPSERWLEAFRVLFLLPVAALCLEIALFTGGTFAALEQMSSGRPNAGVIVLLLLLGSIIHETGHSLVAAACGIGLRPIGFSVYLFFPVFYANVSGMENLPLRRKVAIDCGGFVLQSGYLLALGILWWVFRDISLLESVRWMGLIMIFNLNPLLRTDAYWLYRDLRGGLPQNRVADALHWVYVAAFSSFTLYLFYRVFKGIVPIMSIMVAAFDQPSLFLTEGYKIFLGAYLVVFVCSAGIARLKESRKEMLELRRQDAPDKTRSEHHR